MAVYINGKRVDRIQVDSALADSSNPVKNSVINTHLTNNASLGTTDKSIVGAINELNTKKIGRFETMPEPSATYADRQCYQYIGTNTTDYTHGHFYECVESTTTAGTYLWQEVELGGSVSEWGDIGGTLSNQTDLQDALDKKQNKVFYGDTEPTTAVEGDLWATADATPETLKQTMYDMIYPVGAEHIGFSAPTVPTGVTATWTADTSYNGAALWVDSTKVGTSLSPSLPNIVGTATDARYETGASVWNDYSGAIEKYETSTLTTKLSYGTNANGMTGFKLNAHSFNPIYGGDAGDYVVRPTSKCVAVFRRTA